MNRERPNYAPEIKRALTDVRAVCDALGLTRGGPRTFTKQANGLIVLCPVHNEKTPSCSVQVRQGVLLWKCHGCDAGGDAIDLVAAARGLSMQGRGFRDVLVEAAQLAGLWAVVRALEDDSAEPPPRQALPSPTRFQEPEAPRSYPDDAERFWGNLVPLSEVGGCAEYLWGRGINADLAEGSDVVRAIPDDLALPGWARYRGASWRETGHRLVVTMFDASGALRSVRGWRVTEGDSPKRLPPGGCKAGELVMADRWALAWLRGQRTPERVVIAEGEPDFLTWATRLNDPATALLGIVSGSWTTALANRVPVGCRVDVRVDRDEAGARYFAEIEASLKRRTPSLYRIAQEAA